MHQPADIRVQTANGGKVLAITSPYNADFVAGARELGGKFANTDSFRGWFFDPRDEQRVRALLIAVYGSDGSPVAQTVTLHVVVADYPGTEYDRIIVAGREVAHRRDRDSSVKLSGAVVVAGGFPSSGGSRANPALNAKPGTVLEVRDVPAGHADVHAAGVTVVGEEVDRDSLIAERAALVARLDEIDALLGGSL